ncbi:hypothetical protein [Trueperella abortisuis]|uniref:hypothetical protein n=1 Tax=Trueperella abortisuis TaxID=445930 RepID=UPI00389A8387
MRSKAAHIRGGGRYGGHQARPWVSGPLDNEGSSFWASVCFQLANRGIQDVLIVL